MSILSATRGLFETRTQSRTRSSRRHRDGALSSVRRRLGFLPDLGRLEDRTLLSLLSTFELDGNAQTGVLGTSGSTTTSHDWDQVYADVQNKTNTSGSIGTPVFVHDPVNTTSDNIFTGGSSKDIHGVSQWQWKNGKPQNKDDIADAFAAAYTDTGPGPTTGDTILYTGLDRYSNNGNATVGFWFFQNPVSVNANGTFSGTHTPGDLLLVIDFSTGGGTPTVNTYEWTGTDAIGHHHGGHSSLGFHFCHLELSHHPGHLAVPRQEQ